MDDMQKNEKINNIKLTRNEKDLVRRYFVWCYKTTKEEIDKIDRYFTQLKVDKYVLKELKQPVGCAEDKVSLEFVKFIDQFQDYIKKKEDNVLKLKYQNGKDGNWNPNYQYLFCRMAALEKAILYFLGKNELGKIRMLYEAEMTQRILQAKEHV